MPIPQPEKLLVSKNMQYLRKPPKGTKISKNTKLNEELLQAIRELYVTHNKPLLKIYPMLNINRMAIYDWTTKNYLGFRDFLREIKDERIVEIARGNMPDLLQSKKEHIRSSNTQFVLETKGGYSKKSEMNLNGKGFNTQEEVEALLSGLHGKCGAEEMTKQDNVNLAVLLEEHDPE